MTKQRLYIVRGLPQAAPVRYAHTILDMGFASACFIYPRDATATTRGKYHGEIRDALRTGAPVVACGTYRTHDSLAPVIEIAMEAGATFYIDHVFPARKLSAGGMSNLRREKPVVQWGDPRQYYCAVKSREQQHPKIARQLGLESLKLPYLYRYYYGDDFADTGVWDAQSAD